MELRIPRSDIGQGSGSDPVAFDFHWADNMQNPYYIIEFAVSGDSAPNRRFKYRYDTNAAPEKACNSLWQNEIGCPDDLDYDCDVDFEDFVLFANQWQATVSAVPVSVPINNAGFENPILSAGGTSSGAIDWFDIDIDGTNPITYNPGSGGASEGSNLLSINTYNAAIYQPLSITIEDDTLYTLSADLLVQSFYNPPIAWDPDTAWHFMALQAEGDDLATFGAVYDTEILADYTLDQWHPVSCTWNSSYEPGRVGQSLQIFHWGGNVYIDNVQLSKQLTAGPADFNADGNVSLADLGLLAEGWLQDIVPNTYAGITLLEDNFEGDLSNWTTDWDLATSNSFSLTHSIECSSTDNDLISMDLDTSGKSSIHISFKYKVTDVDVDDNVRLQYYDGSGYDDIIELGDDLEDAWLFYTDTLYNEGVDNQYFINNFRIKIEGTSIDSGEYFHIDDVLIISIE